MKYTKTQFLKDVAAESKLLKENATKEELSELSSEVLVPTNRFKCIYGMATGECRSDRAVELITKCCKRVFKNIVPDDDYGELPDISVAISNVNGGTVNSNDYHYLSSIETYILTKKSKPKNLIAYLRGERKDLVL